MWFKYSLKNLVRKKSYSVFFLLNFCISLVAIFSLFLFQSNIESYINTNAKEILTGEISIQARRDLSELELKNYEEQLASEVNRESRQIAAYSMAYVKDKSRLVLIKAIDKNFPLFGEILLNETQAYAGGGDEALFAEKVLWAYPELLVQMGLSVGDKLRLGKDDFLIQKVVSKDVGIGGFGSALAPALYMSIDNIKKSGLVGFGSTAWYTRYYDLLVDEGIENTQSRWNLVLEDPAIQVNIFTKANQQVGRLQSFLGDYLGLVALVSLLLSIVGAFYLFRSHLVEQAKSIALLEVNGASSFWLLRLFASQILILSLTAGLISLGISSFLGNSWIEVLNLGSTYENIAFSVLPAIQVFGFLLLFILLCMLPFAWKYIGMDKTSALMESKSWDWSFRAKDALLFLPAILSFGFLSVRISNSYVVGGLFLAVIAVGFLFTFLTYRIIILISRKVPFKSFGLKLVFRQLSRDSFGSISILFALGISFLLMGLVPQLQKSLNRELLFPTKQVIPDLFLFDIQDEQLGDLRELVKEQKLELDFLSPMIRSRLMSVNEKDFEKPLDKSRSLTREEEREMRFRNRGFNLSYRGQLSNSESIVAGRFNGSVFSGTENKIPEISIEQRFADRLKLEMNDLLEFDIGGVPVKGKITSFRSVKWTSFQPNFFLLFQPGVLEDAPKTFLGAIGALDKSSKQAVQTQIVERLPNVSIVDVEFLVKRILDLFAKMAAAIEVLAFFSFLAGLFMVFVIANTRAKERRKDFLYLKLFGAKDSFLHSLFRLEFFIVVSVSFLFSLVLSYLLSFFLVSYVFDSTLVFDWKWPLALLFGSLAVCGLITYVITKRMLAKEEYAQLLES